MEKQNNNFILSVLKGTLIALMVMLLSILLFALIVKLAHLNATAVKAVNQFIKVLSIFIGCYFSVRENKGLVKGLIIGLITILLTYLLFILVCGSGSLMGLWIVDVLFVTVIGGISGVTAVNVKKR